jgi:lipoprotein-releasing system ATP-binding protein
MSDGPVISCAGLEKTFASDAEELRVLRGLDLEVPRGQSVAITGASGCGKSTLLSILGGLDRATSGSISVCGWDLAAIPERGLSDFRASAVGFVFQFHFLLKDFTALENAALPAYMRGEGRKSAYGRAASLLRDMGLGDRLGHVPAKLSGGERQRAAIARALINGPGLLLADEPTGNLDSASAQSVRDLLFGLSAAYGTTLVLVTHDAALASGADRRLVLAEGKLATA